MSPHESEVKVEQLSWPQVSLAFCPPDSVQHQEPQLLSLTLLPVVLSID